MSTVNEELHCLVALFLQCKYFQLLIKEKTVFIPCVQRVFYQTNKIMGVRKRVFLYSTYKCYLIKRKTKITYYNLCSLQRRRLVRERKLAL